MGFFDRARQLLGLGGSSDEPDESDESEVEGQAQAAPAPGQAAPGPGLGGGRPRPPARGGRDRADRPPLADAPPPGRTLEDALAAREAGDREGARALLAEIDRGGGLRVVLRAAAALEAGDEAALAPLLPGVRAEARGYRLLLQLAAALGDASAARPYLERAVDEKAPAWALAWTRAAFDDEAERRRGLVELLFADAPLARMVAAREHGVGVVGSSEAPAQAGADAPPRAPRQDADTAGRYASFAHGRDSIRRFGAGAVAALLDRAFGRAA